MGKQISHFQKRLEWLKLQPNSPSIIKDLRENRIELNCWLEKEDVMWRQRARLDWFCEGD